MAELGIERRQENSVLELRLDRPERKNAINLAMYQNLVEQLKAAQEESSIKVVILAGSDGCFTSGNDLQDFASGAGVADDSPIAQFLWAFTTFPKPIVVAVDGAAVGIGTTLLLHCDFAYASPQSAFSLPFVGLGLCPEYASSYLLPRLAGYGKACEWLLLGDVFSAGDACAVGLINKVVDEPLIAAWHTAERLAKLPPAAVKKTKALLKASILPRVQPVMLAEANAFVEALQGPEFAEAVAAFFAKRAPDFSKF